MSLFTNLINLHSGNKPLEDFFTEIVVYFLSLNNKILIDWLKENSIINEDNYSSIKVSNQEKYKKLPSHSEDSRLDIVVELSNALSTDVIFIESKIGSTAGIYQLEKYAEILSSLSYVRHRILIYITREYEPQEEINKFTVTLSPKVYFYQFRWYQFYSFLKEQETDIFAEEILIFMRNNKMSDKNQFSSIDLLTMMNFNKTLNFMQETLSEEVRTKFIANFGNVKPASTSMTQWRWHHRYIIYTYLSGGGNFWCGLGYFNLNSTNLTDYPYLGIYLEVSSGFDKKHKIIESMQKVINDKPNTWIPVNLSITSTWSGIFYRKSLQSFLSTDNQLSDIKNFFLESIEELKNIQPYFDFPLKGVSIESIIQESEEENASL